MDTRENGINNIYVLPEWRNANETPDMKFLTQAEYDKLNEDEKKKISINIDKS